MVQVTTNFRNDCRAMVSSYKFARVHVTEDNANITGNDNLVSFKITGKADENGKVIGSVVTKQLEIEILNNNNQYNLENKRLTIYTGLEETIEDTTGLNTLNAVLNIYPKKNYSQFAPFLITKTTDNQTKGHASYVGYDDMQKFNVLFRDTNTYPCTLNEFLANLCTLVEVPLGSTNIINGDFIIDGNPFTNNETALLVLKHIAQLAGGFAEIGRDGKLYIRSLKNNYDIIQEELDSSQYDEEFTKQPYYGAINKLVVGESTIQGNEAINSDTSDIAINGEHVLEILDNYFLSDSTDKQTICDVLWSKLKGFYYLPFSMNYVGYPYIELNDSIKITDINSNIYYSYVLNFTFEYNGGYSGTLGATAISTTSQKYKNSNSLGTKLKRVEISVDKANGRIDSVIETTDNLGTRITQTQNSIESEARTREQQIDSLSVGGRNYLLDSSKEIPQFCFGKNTEVGSTRMLSCGELFDIPELKVGDYIAIQFEIMLLPYSNRLNTPLNLNMSTPYVINNDWNITLQFNDTEKTPIREILPAHVIQGVYTKITCVYQINKYIQCNAIQFKVKRLYNGMILTRNLKLEKGNFITSYTKAPEDDELELKQFKEQYTEYVSNTTQTSKELSTLVQETRSTLYGADGDNTKGLVKQVQELSTSVSETASQIQIDFNNKITETFNKEHEFTTEEIAKIHKYIRFIDGNIVLGVDGNPIALTIKNNRISFTDTGNEVAYISNNKLMITDATFLNSIDIGNWHYVPQKNGNLSLKYYSN